MEMKYYFTYKCRLCNKEIRYGKPVEIKFENIPKLLGMIASQQQLPGNAPLYLPHNCSKGNFGIASFAGLTLAT